MPARISPHQLRVNRENSLQPLSAGASIERFATYLQTPHAAVPRAKPNYLNLKSVILIPSLSYQTSPIATIPPSNFADLFNTHLLHPILTIQSFLPLLTSRLTPPPTKSQPRPSSHQNAHGPHNHKEDEESGPTTPKVLVFTPSIVSSINPPFHAPEATVCSALSAFTEVLTAELRPLAIPVTHVQLGTFDFGPFTSASAASQPHPILGPKPTLATATGAAGAGAGLSPPGAGQGTSEHPLQWPEAARHAYARNYMAQSESAISAGRVRGLRGSSLRELHNTVFDVIDGTEGRDVVRVGLGAGLYGFVGRFVPRGLVAWMMGIRQVDGLSPWGGPGPKKLGRRGARRRRTSSGSASASGSSQGDRSDDDLGSDSGDEDGAGERSEFIAVVRDENVWKED